MTGSGAGYIWRHITSPTGISFGHADFCTPPRTELPRVKAALLLPLSNLASLSAPLLAELGSGANRDEAH
ncbi:MAG: hypothetical protein QMD17_03605 [Rhodocyclaceae bacterium]|nr:hypothetical protein [Rhodocyclaceae bacterium]